MLRKTPVFLLALVAAVATWLSFRYEVVQRGGVISSDAHAYYSYIPAWFVHGSWDFGFYESLDEEERQRYWVRPARAGKYLPKMSMGLAYAWIPAFWSAHLLAPRLGYEADGWSVPYQLAVLLTGVLFLVAGLFFTWHWLRQWVSGPVASMAVFLLVFATNLLHYGGPQAAFSHVYSFALVAAALWVTSQWLQKPRPHCYLLLGLLFGWTALIRPTNGIFALLPVAVALAEGKGRTHLLQPASIAAAMVFFVPFIPQLLFWRDVTGDWLHYSYGEERIHWLRPHLLEGLFSYRNGWLLYTPVMAIALAGLGWLWKADRRWAAITALLVAAHAYIVFSWWCWYYGDSFGIRPMVDAYALLALPLTMVVRWVASLRVRWWWLALPLIALLVWNNLLQTDQYNRGYISGSAMTREAFHTLFLNVEPPRHLGLIGAYEMPDNDRLRLGLPERTARDTIVEKVVAAETFDSTGNIEAGKEGRALRMDEQTVYSRPLAASAASFETPFDRVLRCKAWVKSPGFETLEAYLVLSFDEGDRNYGYHTVELHKLGLENNRWNPVRLFVRKPAHLPDAGTVKAYFWKKKGPELLVDELRLEQVDCPYSEPLLPGSGD